MLSVDSVSINEYIIDIMEKLFSTSELSAGSIKDDTSDIGSSSRKPLDFDKIKLLKEAVFAKYQISDDKKEEIKEGSRMIIDDSSVKRRDFPADIEEQFKKVAGSSYQ